MSNSSSKRLPKNAAPIPFPASKRNSTGFETSPRSYMSGSMDLPTASPSVYSEIDVVLDDGTLQKRTVSLSTIPCSDDDVMDQQRQETEEPEEMDSQERIHPHQIHGPMDSLAQRLEKNSHEPIDSSSPLLKNQNKKSYSSIRNDAIEDGSFSSTSNESDSDRSFSPFGKNGRYKPISSSKSTRFHSFMNWIASICTRLDNAITLTPKQRLVMKCSFAYFIGSLFTFVPALNALIGYNHVSSHLVATATVFFNPAKSLGGMVEAALYGWGYICFACFICFGSMITTDFFIDRNMFTLAHTLSLCFWLAGATLIIAFFKAHWNKPPVATASSLCFIIIFIIVVREGSANRGDFDATKIGQIVTVLLTGTLVTISCCILFWPVSASKKLKNDLEKTLMSYKVLLKLLTKTFLLDDDLPEFQANRTLQNAIDSHRASFTALQKSLQEAKLEALWNSEMRSCSNEYDAIVKSMQRLAQSVGGLRSSCGLQFERMKEQGKRLETAEELWNIRADHNRRKFEDEIKRERVVKARHEEDVSLIEFIRTIRQPLKSLAYTCKLTIIDLQAEFSNQTHKGPSNETLKNSLVKAIALFEVSQRQAVEKLNRHRKNASFIPKQNVFLVYFFVFNMIEFARELICLVDSAQALCVAKSKRRGVFSLISDVFRYKKKKTKQNNFVPNERHKMNTLHTPVPTTKWRELVVHSWQLLTMFKLQKIRYAIKCSIAATLLASPAFFQATGAWFREWRMEWALITLMVVMTPTVGQTNLTIIYRIFSTVLGCVIAMCLYLLFPDNMYILGPITWLFSIPNFWLILHHKHGKFGQFTLLAYNLVVLNKYNDRETHSIEVTHLTFQRCIAILVGVFVGLVATCYIWPYEARVELRKGVSDFLLRLAWLYQKLVSIYSERPNQVIVDASYQRQQVSLVFMDLELQLQLTLMDLQDLLKQTPNEPRLKGAFPVKTYSDILASCQNITDKFASMRSVILKDEWFEQVQHDFIAPVSHERREVVGNILLYFYILASAMRLKTPLPPYLPPARQAWESLIERLRQLPMVRSKELLKKDHIYLFYYAYVTVLEDIIRELDKLGINMTLLFGAIVPEEQWESLFEPWDIEQNGIMNVLA